MAKRTFKKRIEIDAPGVDDDLLRIAKRKKEEPASAGVIGDRMDFELLARDIAEIIYKDIDWLEVHARVIKKIKCPK